jgi:CBS domain-containing protein
MLDQVAKTMVQHDCGEIPVLDITGRPIGVVTDRDIVCRVVAERKKSDGASCRNMTSDFVVAVRGDAPIRELVSTMEQHQVRRVPVVDVSGCCVGISSQTDVASVARAGQVGELVREVSSTSAFSARSAALDSRHRRR